MSEQPRPKPNNNKASWDLVFEDLIARGEEAVLSDISDRDHQGIQKYGVRLQPHNGRDSIRDAYEEAMDLVVYLKNAIQELPPVVPPTLEYRTLNRVYHTALSLMCALKDYQTWKADLVAEREELEASVVIHPYQPEPGLMDALARGHKRLSEARSRNLPDAPGHPIPSVWLFDTSQTYQAHTGHPVAIQDHSDVVVANIAPVVFIPPGLPVEIQDELMGWKAQMDASLEAEREKHRKSQEELAKVPGHGHQEWGEYS